MDVRLQHPFRLLLSGPSEAGKTEWIRKLIHHRNDMIYPPPEKIIWCYGEWQPIYALMPEIEFVDGLNFKHPVGQRQLLILDDLMMTSNKSVAEIFIKGSHHRNISVIYVTQNLFPKGGENRTISLNASYMVLFKNPRDTSQIRHLSYQMYPKNPKYLQEAYADATQKPYGYLLIDLKNHTPDTYRLRTDIFPQENQTVYCPL